MPESFWKTKTLAEMTPKEWESLCDRCGRCCLNKLEDEEDGKIYFTDVACRLMNIRTGRCSNYEHRLEFVKDCVVLNEEKVYKFNWLPNTCAYRLIAEGKKLRWWHPLISGKQSTVHEAGISVRGRVVSEYDVANADLEEHIVRWVK